MPTKQETFDAIVNHLRKQGCKSVRENDPNFCLYRGPNGTKCAAGCLIPDDKYTPDMENQTLCLGSCRDTVTNCIRELGHDLYLVYHMQLVHDGCPVEEWEDRFQQVANEHRLVYTPRGIHDNG